MGELTRNFDWGQTPIGAPDNWSPGLRSTVANLLNSSFPMFLFWGKELTCFYNDAFRPSFGIDGKHPALGMHGKDVWAEIWDFIGPLIEGVMATEKPVWFEDQLVPFYRNGRMEDIYWTFSYSPAHGEDGSVQGMLVTCIETTGTVAAKKKLEQSEQNLRNTIMQSPVAMCIIRGSDNIIEIANERIIDLWGVRGRDVIGKPIFTAIPEVAGQGFEGLMANVYTTGETYRAFGVPITTSDNKNGLRTIYIDFLYEPYREPDGAISGIIAVAIDATEQVLAHQKAEESESRFRNMVKQASVAIMLTRGTDIVIENINRPMLQFLGKQSEEEVVGKRMVELFPELEGQAGLAIVKNVAASGEPYEAFEVPISLNIEGRLTERFFDLSYTPLKEENSETGVLHLATDVTQRVTARRRIEQSEQRFQNLVREASVGIVVLMGQEMRVSLVNAAYGRLINLTVNELLDKPLFDLIPDAEAMFRPLLDNVRLTGEPLFLYDTPYLVYTNAEKIEGYLNVVYQPYREADGSITGVMALCQDVTEQVKARQNLEEANERVRLAMEAGELGTIEVNLQTDEVIINKRTEEIFDIKAGDSRTAFVSKLHLDDLPVRNKAYEKAMQDGLLEYEARVVRADKLPRWIRVKGRVFFDETGKALRLVSVVHDISKEKAFAEELQKQVSERTKELELSNEELQQFAHVASHDLKEPVRKIRTFGSRLKSEYGSVMPERAMVYLERMESAAHRIYSMIEGVLHYSSVDGSRQATEPVNLAQLIVQIQEDLEVLIQQKNAVVKVAKLPIIDGSEVLLYQLFYNLLGNSLKFSGADTVPVIDIRSKVETTAQANGERQKVAIIKIEDNGIGFPQGKAEDIFNTFTRLHSKDRYEGTGLGLSLCKRIVERHGGSITAEGRENQGSVFTVILPVKQN